MTYDLYLDYPGDTAVVTAEIFGRGPDINVTISDVAGTLNVVLTPAQAATLCTQIQTAETRAGRAAAAVDRALAAAEANEVDRMIGPDDEPTAEEMHRWHDTDRPGCNERLWAAMERPGVQCTACGWRLGIAAHDQADALTDRVR